MKILSATQAMTSEIAPRRRERIYCPVVGRIVEHVILSLEDGRIRWCQNCFIVIEDGDWESRCGAEGPQG